VIDAMLELPRQTVREKIPPDQATKSVLVGQPSGLRPVFFVDAGACERRMGGSRGVERGHRSESGGSGWMLPAGEAMGAETSLELARDCFARGSW